MSGENITELEDLLRAENAGERVTLDLEDRTLVDGDIVRFWLSAKPKAPSCATVLCLSANGSLARNGCHSQDGNANHDQRHPDPSLERRRSPATS